MNGYCNVDEEKGEGTLPHDVSVTDAHPIYEEQILEPKRSEKTHPAESNVRETSRKDWGQK